MSGSTPTVTLEITVLPTARATGSVEGQGVRLRVIARDGVTKLPVAVTGLRVLARAPRSAVPTAYAQNQLTVVRTGEWTADLVLGVPARWRFRAECTGPRAAAVETTYTVATSAVLQPEPPDVVVVTPEGEVITTPDGAALTARRVDRLAGLGTLAANDLLLSVRGGVAGTVTRDAFVAATLAALDPSDVAALLGLPAADFSRGANAAVLTYL